MVGPRGIAILEVNVTGVNLEFNFYLILLN